LCYIIARLMNGVNHRYDVCLIYGILMRGRRGDEGRRRGWLSRTSIPERIITWVTCQRERREELRPVGLLIIEPLARARERSRGSVRAMRRNDPRERSRPHAARGEC